MASQEGSVEEEHRFEVERRSAPTRMNASAAPPLQNTLSTNPQFIFAKRHLKLYHGLASLALIVLFVGVGVLVQVKEPGATVLGVTVLRWGVFLSIVTLAVWLARLACKGVLVVLQWSLKVDAAFLLVQGIESGIRVSFVALVFKIAWSPVLAGIDETHNLSFISNRLAEALVAISAARVLKNVAAKAVGGRVLTRSLYDEIRLSILHERILSRLRSPRAGPGAGRACPGCGSCGSWRRTCGGAGAPSASPPGPSPPLPRAPVGPAGGAGVPPAPSPPPPPGTPTPPGTGEEGEEQQQRSQRRVAAPSPAVGAGTLSRADVERVVGREHSAEALRLFDLDRAEGAGAGATYEAAVRSIVRVCQERERLSKQLRDQTQIGGVLDQIIDFAFWILAALCGLIWVGVDVYRVVIPLGSLFLALSFALGETVKGIFESLIMVFVEAPYSVGEEISIDRTGQIYVVDRIRLMTTVCHRIEGESVTLSNARLARCELMNLSRAHHVMIRLELEVDFDTPASKVAVLRSRVLAQLSARPQLFAEGTFLLEVARFNNDKGTIALGAQVNVRARASQRGLWFPARSAFAYALQEGASALEIRTYAPLRLLCLPGAPGPAPDAPKAASGSPASAPSTPSAHDRPLPNPFL
eukprot:tig00021127_g18709.t1